MFDHLKYFGMYGGKLERQTISIHVLNRINENWVWYEHWWLVIRCTYKVTVHLSYWSSDSRTRLLILCNYIWPLDGKKTTHKLEKQKNRTHPEECRGHTFCALTEIDIVFTKFFRTTTYFVPLLATTSISRNVII